MRIIWKIGASLPAVLFMVMGLGWLLAPGLVSEQMRMPLLEGDGRSTQIGDLAAFFLTMGGTILIALRTNRSVWLYPPIMLLLLSATGRVIAWLAHGAGLTLDMILVEVVVAGTLFMLARKLGVDEAKPRVASRGRQS